VGALRACAAYSEFSLSKSRVSVCQYVPADRLAFWVTFVLVDGESHLLSETSYDVEPRGDPLFLMEKVLQRALYSAGSLCKMLSYQS
jgi:hypothetical protein